MGGPMGGAGPAGFPGYGAYPGNFAPPPVNDPMWSYFRAIAGQVSTCPIVFTSIATCNLLKYRLFL